jgi:hypothetical protein
MKTSWQSESGGLICRWSGLLDDESNSPITLRASTEAYASFMPPVPDFVTHSLLGESGTFPGTCGQAYLALHQWSIKATFSSPE